MNLEELKENIDSTIRHLNDYENPKNIMVLISLKENSMGGRASSGVSCVGMGFDWEHGQFRIEPTKSLVSMGNAITDIKSVICKEYDGRKYYKCPRCESKISKNDNYCRECGQKLK